MKTAVIQMQAGEAKGRNIQRALNFIEEAAAQSARFILLPEVFNYRGRMTTKQDRQVVGEEIPGESTRPLMEAAQRHQVFILAGSIYEKKKGFDKVYNASILISPAGKITAKYRKIHLFDAVLNQKIIKESDTFLAGKKTAVGRVDGFNLGMTICYDVRFPELYRACARLGAQVFCVPSVFTKITGQAHWKVLLRARAIENFCYVLAPNQVGTDDRGMEAFGHSLIVSPWGEILAQACAAKEEIIFAELSLSDIQKARRVFPSTQRPDASIGADAPRGRHSDQNLFWRRKTPIPMFQSGCR